MYDEIIEEHPIQAADRRIYGTLHIPSSSAAKHPLVIMSHGFGGAHFPQDELASQLTHAGYMAYGFDFCGGGVASKSDGSMLDMSVLTEADDLNAVIDALLQRPDVDPSKVCLFGRSQGGFVSAYVAAHRPQDIAALVMYFPAFVLQDDARARANEQGRFPETSCIAGKTVGRKYSEDAISFDIYDVIGGYQGKVLIVHGDADKIVPLSYSQRALSLYKDAKLVVLPGQGHGFREGGNPEAAKETLAFLREVFA
ncbi:MAG: alpha/beta fold hydrolase [Eggerthellaceae bacterium]|nr:alpha/beta fold hydrolase [Eggerthellaceae bacterium]